MEHSGPLRLAVLVRGSHKGVLVLFTVIELGLLNNDSLLPVQHIQLVAQTVETSVEERAHLRGRRM